MGTVSNAMSVFTEEEAEQLTKWINENPDLMWKYSNMVGDVSIRGYNFGRQCANVFTVLLIGGGALIAWKIKKKHDKKKEVEKEEA